MAVGPEDSVLAATEVGVDLAWEEGVLGDVGVAGVFV